jgi:hypothetical protein
MARVALNRKSPVSPLAVPGKTKILDDHLWSSIVLQHGGQGQAKLFTNPEGTDIYKVHGSSITASTQAHHDKHGQHSTNLSQSGQLGNEIGDVTIKKLGIFYEQAGHTAAGAYKAYGFTPSDIADILAKCTIVIKVGGAEYGKGPVGLYGQLSGVIASISTTETGQTLGFGSSGPIGMGRSVSQVPIQATQTDLLKVEFNVANGASLDFYTTSGEGQPGLFRLEAHIVSSGEVRG